MIELLLLLLLLLIILLIYYLKSSREYLWGSIIRGPKIRWVILFPERSYWPISCGVLKKKRKEKHTYIGTLNFMHLSSFIRDHRLVDLTVWAHLARNVVENIGTSHIKADKKYDRKDLAKQYTCYFKIITSSSRDGEKFSSVLIGFVKNILLFMAFHCRKKL